jgi:hypothetical protein
MSRVRKDVAATLLTAAIVAVFAATHEGWNVWLVGDSRRWAAAAILALGAVSCSLGSPQERREASVSFVLLGVAALASGVVALATASLTALSLLVAADVLLWAASTIRHVRQHPLPA